MKTSKEWTLVDNKGVSGTYQNTAGWKICYTTQWEITRPDGFTYSKGYQQMETAKRAVEKMMAK